MQTLLSTAKTVLQLYLLVMFVGLSSLISEELFLYLFEQLDIQATHRPMK